MTEEVDTTVASRKAPVLSPSVHAKLAPQSYLSAHLLSNPSIRPGTTTRGPIDARGINIQTGSLSHAHGSAVVRIGDSSVVCGVRGEILRGDDIVDYDFCKDELSAQKRQDAQDTGEHDDRMELAHLGLLVPNVEIATGCSPDHLPGGPPSEIAQTVTQRIATLLHTATIVKLDGLRIWQKTNESAADQSNAPAESCISRGSKVKAFWTLYIDILFISLDHGPNSIIDVAWICILAALQNTMLPKAWWDADTEDVLCSPDSAEKTPLHLSFSHPLSDKSNLPICLSSAVFSTKSRQRRDHHEPSVSSRTEIVGDKHILCDPSAFEESICDECMTITISGPSPNNVSTASKTLHDQYQIIRIEKNGGSVIGPDQVSMVIQKAITRRQVVIEALNIAIQSSER